MTEEQDARKLYADIIDLPRPVNKRRKHIPPAERAAQFAPFAALTGYEEVIEETALRRQAQVMAADRMKD